MIKNIVFDLGNVLVDFDPVRFVREKTENKEEQTALCSEIFGSVDWLRFDKGTITKAELALSVKTRLPKELHEIADELLSTWYNGLHPLPQMAELPRQLKEKGFGVYLLSNAPQDYYVYEEMVPSRCSFDGFFISSDWKLAKPEHKIFEAFYSHFRLNPAECYFIDDSAANILAAEETGMRGFHFKKDFAALNKDLSKFLLL
ncbi:HAD family hydrolase [Enterococcus sp. AZ196]|uniref:HAD family hydrolase n=1 Tax=Enterococcus sp. AZ196 TaxID=2774659 RepID=UPI003D29FB94